MAVIPQRLAALQGLGIGYEDQKGRTLGRDLPHARFYLKDFAPFAVSAASRLKY